MKKFNHIQKDFQVLNHLSINVTRKDKLSVKNRWQENVWEN